MFDDPYNALKNQALKIWDTKDYANRLAFNNTQWFLALVWCFMFVTILDLVILVLVGDLFVLWKFYSSNTWYVTFLEDVFYETTFLRIGLIFFFASPKIVRFELLVWRSYNQRERRMFEWLEGKIKQRFPNFKTSAQRTRERLEKPRKESKVEKWIKSRPPVERRLIRLAIWICWGISMAFFIIFLFNIDELIFEQEVEEIKEQIPVNQAEEAPPTKPDRRPPPTIYDIFINEPDLVTP